MEHVHKCTSVLRPLIAEGEPNGIPLAEKAIKDLMDATPAPGQRASLESVQAAVQAQRDAAEGCQLRFADTINDYIEKLMRSFE
jgi:alpha-D-ribose 1-methylphosphonate 5-triphosphate synthase subunit PhnH